MIRINSEELLRNTSSDDTRRAREAALRILTAAVSSVHPKIAMKNRIHRENNMLNVNSCVIDLDNFEHIIVVGGGKGSGAIAETLEEILGDRIEGGWVNILRGTKSMFDIKRIHLNEAGHPIPDEDGFAGAKEIIKLVERAGRSDLVFCLISGGGSALMPFPAEGITLRDKQDLTEALLKSGATINEINAVRKHISGLKGGQLAKSTYPATLISLILSDVIEDHVDTIASGPTAPDETTFKDAILTLKKYGLWTDETPSSIKKRLKAGLLGNIRETPKPDDVIFNKTHNIIVGNNRDAALAAWTEAKHLGFNSLLLTSLAQGEARHLGTFYSGIIKEILQSKNPISKPAVVVSGGESTVTVNGSGKGGRNQELVLSASQGIENLTGVAIASINTDGIDGPTKAAGAIADGQTLKRARQKNLDSRVFLADNNSFNFFFELGDLILTGPTNTNVGDVCIMVLV